MQQEQEVPEKYIQEIIRWYQKLKDAGLTEVDLTIEQTKKIVNNKLQITTNLKAGKLLLASNVAVANKSLSAIKQEAEVQKASLEEAHAQTIANIDEVIAVVDSGVIKGK